MTAFTSMPAVGPLLPVGRGDSRFRPILVLKRAWRVLHTSMSAVGPLLPVGRGDSRFRPILVLKRA